MDLITTTFTIVNTNITPFIGYLIGVQGYVLINKKHLISLHRKTCQIMYILYFHTSKVSLWPMIMTETVSTSSAVTINQFHRRMIVSRF